MLIQYKILQIKNFLKKNQKKKNRSFAIHKEKHRFELALEQAKSRASLERIVNVS